MCDLRTIGVSAGHECALDSTHVHRDQRFAKFHGYERNTRTTRTLNNARVATSHSSTPVIFIKPWSYKMSVGSSIEKFRTGLYVVFLTNSSLCYDSITLRGEIRATAMVSCSTTR
uniref:Uncharacterized protein n=1 Tax=Physcomitrium patens TaxID=3218 RepID=A0A2K1KNX3_PHYPA|nr:hypothetical protein PHYPA_006381 [Physcomitrium patens]